MRIAATFALALGLFGLSAYAQTPAVSPSAAPGGPAAVAQAAETVKRLCAKVTFDSEMTPQEIATAKQCLDAINVQQNNAKLDLENERLRLEVQKAKAGPDPTAQFLSLLATAGPMAAAAFAFMGAVIGYWFKANEERRLAVLQAQHARDEFARKSTHDKEEFERKAAAERDERREIRALSLLDTLSGDSPAKRSYAVAGLLSNIAANTEDERQETEMIIAALFARVRDTKLELGESKYIADELGKFFRTRSANYKLADFNLQQARLLKAYWAKLDATNADFFEADLTETSLRGANLTGAVFKGANLSGVVFVDAILNGADLRGANLQGALLADAHGLETTKLDATTIANAATTWPPGFDPVARGVTIVA